MILPLRPWVGAQERKATAGWVTTIMNKNVLRGSKSGTSDFRLRAEMEAAIE